MKLFSPAKIIIAAIILLGGSLYAQGTMRGTVQDSLAEYPLVGANVYITGTSLGNSTNIEGEYRITMIPEGSYNVKISYIGYKAKEIKVNIEKGKTLQLDVYLEPDVVMSETVVVTSQALGQAAAINQQLASNTIINVVSEEKIKELPDANAAESIGRLPGVALSRSGGEASKVVLRGLSDKFSSITVDGVRMAATDSSSRGVDLSSISQGSLAGIELYKALTADMDGDAIAGSVNLVTRRAPSTRELRLDTRGAYNDLKKTYEQYDFQLRYGERFFSDLLGLQLIGNLEQRDRSKENFDMSYSTSAYADGSNYEISDIELDFTDELRKRSGLSLLLDFNTPDEGFIKINNIYNETKRDYIEYNRNYPTDGSELFYGARDIEREIKSFNSSVSGENHLLGFDINWSASFAQSKAENPFDYTISFLEPSSLDGQGNPVSGMLSIPTEYIRGPIERIQEYALNNFQMAYLYNAYYRKQKTLDKEKAAVLNITRKYVVGDLFSGELKFGGKYRHKYRFMENSEVLSPYYVEPFPGYVLASDGTLVPKNFDGTRFAGLETIGGQKISLNNFLDADPANRNIYDKYRLYPLINRDAIRLWWDLNKNGYTGANNPEYEKNYEADANYYNVTERVAAGYIMNTFQIGNFITFIAGIRAENEDNDYSSKYSPQSLAGFPTPKGILKDTTAAHNETLWLPNFQLSLRPLEYLNVRFAAYKALARPDFNDRLANYISRGVGTFYSGNSLIVGNPNLMAAKAWNFEINASLFGNDIGLFSVSAFYKEIKDMYHLMNGVRLNGQAPLDSLGITVKQPFGTVDYFLRYPYNSKKPTYVWGFEIEHQANLGFLPGLLKNIVLSYNLSIVRSETYITSTKIRVDTVLNPPWPPYLNPVTVLYENKQKLEGQPEFFGNFAIGYDIDGFSGRISLFYQSEYNQRFTPNGRSDTQVNEFTKIDIALKQELFDFLSVMLNLNNITNAKEETSNLNRVTGWRLLNESEMYGFTADLGVRITL